MKVFISQPMKGRSEADIRNVRNMAATMADIFCGEFEEETEILDSYISNVPKGGTMPLRFLARSLDLLAQADVVIFAPGWESARGCRIEELCKRCRGRDNVEAIAEEVADVQIMLQQLVMLFDCKETVDKYRRYKLERLAGRIKEVKEHEHE